MHLFTTLQSTPKAKVSVDVTTLMMFQSRNYMSKHSYRINV